MNPLRRRLLLLGGATLLLLVGCSGTSLHSLRYFWTLVSDPDQAVPRFYLVGYVDEQPFVSYDVATKRLVPLVSWIEEVEKDYPKYWDRQSLAIQVLETEFRMDQVTLQDRYNRSGGSSGTGVHTLQVMISCEMGADGRFAAGYRQVGYDGEDFLSFDHKTLTWTAPVPQALETKRHWESDRIFTQRVKAYLEEDCVEWLRRYLRYRNETLQRTVPPTVKVARKVYQDGQETLFCQAHGFYPKEIEVTWMKDGVQQQDTLTGGVVPNSDGTYHKWLSIDVDPKDRNHYWCQVAHDGLQEPLDLAWEEPASSVYAGVLVGVLLAAVLVGGVIVYRIKKRNHANRHYEQPAGVERLNYEKPGVVMRAILEDWRDDTSYKAAKFSYYAIIERAKVVASIKMVTD